MCYQKFQSMFSILDGREPRVRHQVKAIQDDMIRTYELSLRYDTVLIPQNLVRSAQYYVLLLNLCMLQNHKQPAEATIYHSTVYECQKYNDIQLSQFDSSAHNHTLRLRIFTSPLSGPPNIHLAFWTFLWSSKDSISFSVCNSKTSFAAFLNSITFLISTQFHFQRSSNTRSAKEPRYRSSEQQTARRRRHASQSTKSTNLKSGNCCQC